MNKSKLIELYKKESMNVFKNIPTNKIVEFVDMVFEAYENEQTLFACGLSLFLSFFFSFIVERYV